VFDKHRRSFKGSARRSRTEQFLEWAQENPDEVLVVQQAEADKAVEGLATAGTRAPASDPSVAASQASAGRAEAPSRRTLLVTAARDPAAAPIAAAYGAVRRSAGPPSP
jgi:hypothetical protein